jgi:hypothetical protein
MLDRCPITVLVEPGPVDFPHRYQCFPENFQHVPGSLLGKAAQVELLRGQGQARKEGVLAWHFHSHFRHSLEHSHQVLT